MPKGIRFSKLGGPEVLELQDVQVREPGEGEVKLQVEAVGLNRAESMYFHGHYMEQPQLPSGLGYEAVGVVTAVGPRGDKSLVGKRFGTVPGYSMNTYPVLAEEAVVPAYSLAAVPESMSASEAAAVWMQYMTAYGALVFHGKVTTGDFAIVTAASSSVGLAAIQIVKAEGGTAIATTRTSEKKEELLALGADFVIATGEEDLPEKVKEITGGKGARLIFDPVAGPYLETLTKAAAVDGIVYQYGWLSLQPTPFPLMDALGKSLSIRGYTLHEVIRRPEELEKAKKWIYERLADGRFTPKVAKTFSLADTKKAYEYLESNQQVGKLVIEVKQ